MPDVFLLRHGETAWNRDNNRYCGRTDIPLTENGIRQAEATRDQLKNTRFDQVYASPLQRAYTTAQIAGGGIAVTKEQRLIEMDFGQWEKKTKEEFIPENEQLWADWGRDPGHTRAGGTGETALEVIKRVDAFFSELPIRHPSGNILVAGHNGINRFYLCHKLGMPLQHYRRLLQQNAAVTVFSLDSNGDFVLKHLNSKGL
jgi:alpha-ribazole phosphatase/probable phosphoglycerate mutase